METPVDLSAHPGVLVRQACARLGTDEVIDWCVELLTARIDAVRASSDPTLPSLQWIGGAAVGGSSGWSVADPVNAHWVRVWAARAFLYVWRDDIAEALIGAAGDEAWRVREHVARITAARELGSVAPYLVPLLDDELPRVRSAAVRALGAAGEAEHAAAVADLRDDDELTVRAAAERALERMSRRLDRSIPDLLDG